MSGVFLCRKEALRRIESRSRHDPFEKRQKMKFIKYVLTLVSAAAISPFMFGEESVPAENRPENPPPAAEQQAAPAQENVSAEKAVPADTEKDLTDEQKKQLEIRLLSARKAKLDAEVALGKARLSEKLTARSIERKRLETENELRTARNEAKFAELEIQKRKLDAEAARDKAREELALLERNAKLREAEIDFKIAKTTRELAIARGKREVERVKTAEKLRAIAVPEAAPAYRKDPLENGTLYISDRRVACNGVVNTALAADIVERIALLNNQNSEYPIFLVIDSSPGGSVAAGYQILKAMESSKAPVYVVVKNYAASMAAVITTWADRSFCYPGTVLLHHQPSSGFKGNLTQMTEDLKHVTAWTRRINDRIAAKMGMTYEEFVAQMYKHNSKGDWTEFGDGAKEWKWVTDVVDAMDESSVVRKVETPTPKNAPDEKKSYLIDERGRPYVLLPTLAPGDFWMIYDPSDFYRVGA